MKASLFYRIAAGLLLVFAVAHTLGFSQTDPSMAAVVTPMRSVHFDVMGSSRTFWDLFLAAGYSVGVLYAVAAIVAWQLGGLPDESLARLRIATWALALGFAAIGVVSWLYLFIVPVVFAALVALSFAGAALLASRR